MIIVTFLSSVQSTPAVVAVYSIYLFIFFATGNIINVETGEWTGKMSGLGAGLDSFYEYLLKVLYRKAIVNATKCIVELYKYRPILRN